MIIEWPQFGLKRNQINSIGRTSCTRFSIGSLCTSVLMAWHDQLFFACTINNQILFKYLIHGSTNFAWPACRKPAIRNTKGKAIILVGVLLTWRKNQFLNHGPCSGKYQAQENLCSSLYCPTLHIQNSFTRLLLLSPAPFQERHHNPPTEHQPFHQKGGHPAVQMQAYFHQVQ